MTTIRGVWVAGAVIAAAFDIGMPAAEAATLLGGSGAITVGCPFNVSNSVQHNAGYQDTYATYGTAQIPLAVPAGDKITIRGNFVKARYFSIQSYDGLSFGNYIDSLADALIVPTASGATPSANPAVLPDGPAYANDAYTATVVYSEPPAAPALRAPNTLYVGPPVARSLTRTSKQLMYRVYFPNSESLDALGGFPAPRLVYSGPTGDTDFANTPDAQKCERINALADKAGTLSPQLLPGKGIAFSGSVQAQGKTLYPNGDTNYLTASSSQLYAPIVLVRSRTFVVPALPLYPQPAGGPDIRYWSFCGYNLTSGAVSACAADRALTSQGDGYNSVVVSSAANRPTLATTANGYNWLDSGGNSSQELILRQTLSRPGFAGDYANAVAQPEVALATTLGAWAPLVTYCDKATFAAAAPMGGAALYRACKAKYP